MIPDRIDELTDLCERAEKLFDERRAIETEASAVARMPESFNRYRAEGKLNGMHSNWLYVLDRWRADWQLRRTAAKNQETKK